MALKSPTLIPLSIFTLSFFALYCNATSSLSPSLSPSSFESEPPSDEQLSDVESPSGEQPTDAESPMSLSELFELTLPEIGVQKKAVSSTEESNVASKQLEALELKINDFKSVLEKRLSDPNTLGSMKTCLTQCQENFSNAINGVKKSIESIRKQDMAKANVDVSAIATDVDTCNDCFVDMKIEDSEIKAVNDWVKGITGDCLANLKKA